MEQELLQMSDGRFDRIKIEKHHIELILTDI